MSVNRHPAGTSVGGQWAPGAAGEVDDTLSTDQEVSAEQRSMSGARTVLAGGDFGGDLTPAIDALNRNEDHRSADVLIKYQGTRSLHEQSVVDSVSEIGTRSRVGEVFDDETRPLDSGILRRADADSVAYGLSRHDDGSYRVRVFRESDVATELTTGDRTEHGQVRVNTLMTDRVESTGQAGDDAQAIRASVEKMADHEQGSTSVVDDAAHDHAGLGTDEDLTREFTFDSEVEPSLGDEIEVLDH